MLKNGRGSPSQLRQQERACLRDRRSQPERTQSLCSRQRCPHFLYHSGHGTRTQAMCMEKPQSPKLQGQAARQSEGKRLKPGPGPGPGQVSPRPPQSPGKRQNQEPNTETPNYRCRQAGRGPQPRAHLCGPVVSAQSPLSEGSRCTPGYLQSQTQSTK